ncbi:intermembrane phospholipid transport protein YdbH family protein [Desulfospira joergensenii]|uniref:intermembrane phospholipid transport protein YdbH family protein n=1 Tax=Desulfospira joergensenii TaxID=53329 RepID=UPI0003B598E0|nr:YdbH domain-containing protein [Desulfospira joergensenii]
MRFKTLIKIGLVSGLVLFACLMLLAAGLPFIAEQAIHQKFKETLRERDIQFRIDRIGASRMVISGLGMGRGLSADQVVLEYEWDLSQPFPFWLSPQKLILSGISLKGEMDESNKFIIQGIGPETGSVSGDTEKSVQDILPLLPKKLVVKNSLIFLTLRGRGIHIPFEVLASIDQENKRTDLSGEFTLFGNKVQILAGLDLRKLSIRDFAGAIQSFTMDAAGFELGDLVSLLGPSDSPFLFSGGSDIRIVKKGRSDWGVSLSKINLARPWGLGIDSLSADLGLENKILTLNTGFNLICRELPGIRIQKPGSGSKEPGPLPISLSGRLQLDLGGGGQGPKLKSLNLETSTLKGLVVAQDLQRIRVEDPFMALTLKGDKEKIKGKIFIRSGRVWADLEGGKIAGRSLEIESDIRGKAYETSKQAGTGLSLALDLKSRISGIRVGASGVRGEFKALETRALFRFDGGDNPELTGVAGLINGQVSFPGLGVECRGIRASLPFKIGADGRYKQGTFSVDSIQYGKRPGIRMSGEMAQTGPLELEFKGDLACPDVEELKLDFSGNADLDKTVSARVDFSAPFFRLLSERVRALVPELGLAAEYDLGLSCRGGISYKGEKIQTHGKVIIHDGSLSLPDMNLKAEGIEAALELNDLLTPESLPGQILTMESIESGKLKFTDARIRFSIEDGEFIHIENARAGWCKGLVTSESIRFPSKDRQNKLIIYCDRLELARLLEQIGAFQAMGEGTLSGRIPVTYAHGSISFDNGFLFSTPGKGGAVKIGNTEKITTGIPVDSPQFVQLDLAREALKNFDYTWAKLSLNTVKDTLDLKMELDGKPSNVLPFEYKKELGSFVRVKAGSPGSHFQGIKLDVNLKLPFNQVMKFGTRIESLFK